MITPKKSIIIITALMLLVTVSACNRTPARTVTRSFYYWKSVFELQAADVNDLKQLQIKRLYLKFFDVVWDAGYGGPIPVSALRFKTSPPAGLEIIPVVFITVDALERLPAAQCRELARKIYQRIHSIQARNQLGSSSEIQLDCDWTESVKVKYFTILAELRELAKGQNLKFSATIRLHQVKYASQTGIPPVERGMLMFYNFGSVKDPKSKNSILDLREGKQYIGNLGKYPLPLDIALPLFSWGVVFQGNLFQGIIGNLTLTDLASNRDFQKISGPEISGDRFRALRDCYLKNVRIYQNDTIRVEESRYKECLAGAHMLSERIRNTQVKVALFHFDHNLIQGAGGNEKVLTLYDSFR